MPESGNNRVVMFAAAATKPDGGAADLVLGQPGFSSQTAATTQQGLASLWNVAVDGGERLWIADAFNNRVLMFEADEPTATVTTTPSETPTLTPSVTPSTTPIVTPSVTPSLTPSPTPSLTPSTTPSTTPSATATVPAKPALQPRVYIPAVRR